MADFRTPTTRYGTAVPAASVGELDLGLRAYMLRVYNYMVVGLVITGVVSLLTYNLATTTDPAQAAGQIGSTLLTSLGVTLYGSALQWVIIFAPVALVIFLSVRLSRMSVAAAQLSFWAFAALMGLSLSSIFLVYTSQSIAQVFFVTAATFGAVSLWGYTTKRDLTGWGNFLFMGLIGILIASIVNIFLGSDALGFAISIIGVLVFTGLTAYDTQKIKEMYSANDDGTLIGRKAILGALNLYLDFINLFLMLLRLFGNRN